MSNQNISAEFIGVMLGDGSIGIYNTRAGNKIKINRCVKVTLDSRNKTYWLYVKKLMKKALDVEPNISLKKTENAVDIRTHRKDAIDYVLNVLGLKISPKWGNMIIPKPYDSGVMGLKVLKGIFDTDGHLCIFKNNGIDYPRIEIRLCPSPAQKQINNILDEFNFNYKIQNLERGKTRIRISGKKEVLKWYNLIGSSNPIHLKKFEKINSQ